MDVVKAIEANPTDDSDKPIKEVLISNAGVEEVTPFAVTLDAATD